VAFEKDGAFSIKEAASGEVLLSDARFALPWDRRGKVESISAEEIHDELGRGKRVIVEVTDASELSYPAPAKRWFTYALYENHPALVCGFGIKTPNYLSLRLRDARPLGGGKFFGGKTIEKPMTLNGSAGAEHTSVEPGLTRNSANSLMLTGLVEGKRRTAVWGGLRYREFGAYAALHDGSPAVYSEDPVGRLIDEDQSWMAHDTLYLDVHTREPFEAMERYGLAMRAANHARPNVYDFSRPVRLERGRAQQAAGCGQNGQTDRRAEISERLRDDEIHQGLAAAGAGQISLRYRAGLVGRRAHAQVRASG
jgi:hypothetical protein